MSVMRPKNQLWLAFMTEESGETRTERPEGTETRKAGGAPDIPADGQRLMEEICREENLKKALKKVQSNKGSPGVDGMTVERLGDYLERHWPNIREQLLRGTYRPQVVKRQEIPKPDGGVRKLGIPTALDRFIQQAILQTLQPQWDPTFSTHSYGFRPGRSAHQAVAQAQTYIAHGCDWVVDLDLEKFFDRVNHDKLMAAVAKRVKDKRLLRLIRAYLTAGVMDDGLVSPIDEGTPQGGPLSPLLSNLVLDELDRELQRRKLYFVRYADDSNIYVRSQRAGERVMASLKRFITQRLKLKVNDAKSAVARPHERKFLGFSFTWGQGCKRRVAPKALMRFKKRVRELTRRTRGKSLKQVIAELTVYLRGWNGYFQHCQTPSVLTHLNEWVRRRLRCFQWKQWKRGRRRFAELRKRGISKDLAAQTAGSPKGPWCISGSPAMQYAFTNQVLEAMGLFSLKVASSA